MAFSMSFSPRALLWLSRLGLAYVVLFICLIFFTGVSVIIPQLYGNSLIHYVIGVYIFIGVSVNLFYCYRFNSFIEKKEKQAEKDLSSVSSASTTHSHDSTTNSSGCSTKDSVDHHVDGVVPSSGHSKSHCDVCNIEMPHRSHHCILCQRCVLVREHHCFFIGSCIGQKNLKYFIIFLFHLSFGCMYALCLNYKYLTMNYVCPISWNFFEFFPPITLIEILLDYRTWTFGYYVLGLYVTLTGFIGSTFGYVWYFLLVLMGITSHEYYTKSSRSKFGKYYNFKMVFGRYWYITIPCPLPVFEDAHSKFDVKLV
ncbi:hypothetical protein HELRODRAFT_179858 [Helobdella robusta]|uniref:Palmitoyltransferase n=1 Tax=Helobdella robusta TaxID=6412 RepID=T1FF78_HELRO|nr:hypothetical protein HELRODRAFT_179858 [Helobdella robusta]ESN95011.1 hypothetical protein HELRODRAFT_179858 [Helobdella robusta]